MARYLSLGLDAAVRLQRIALDMAACDGLGPISVSVVDPTGVQLCSTIMAGLEWRHPTAQQVAQAAVAGRSLQEGAILVSLPSLADVVGALGITGRPPSENLALAEAAVQAFTLGNSDLEYRHFIPR